MQRDRDSQGQRAPGFCWQSEAPCRRKFSEPDGQILRNFCNLRALFSEKKCVRARSNAYAIPARRQEMRKCERPRSRIRLTWQFSLSWNDLPCTALVRTETVGDESMNCSRRWQPIHEKSSASSHSLRDRKCIFLSKGGTDPYVCTETGDAFHRLSWIKAR